ncbi:MAG: SH3 domain-containing protein [Anaerolineae bacterium]|nr:SH3 domain-containing protein [Anaerolineae bacterium]MCO5190553.1 SH3 domain-containing protein [Anaerolineae bacterium]MCO5193872.1 SH3 domain-containing protein [Anaerolineae bacterium]MCO5197979.1 SH3 domain-containing protein [Anaerolineae bacterium]
MQHLHLDDPHITPHSGCPFRGIGDDTSTQTLFATEQACCFKDDVKRQIDLDHQTYFCLTSAHVMCPIYQGIVEEPAADPHDGSQVKGHVLIAAMIGIVALLCLVTWLALYPPISVAADKTKSEPEFALTTETQVGSVATEQKPTAVPNTPVPTPTSIIAAVLSTATPPESEAFVPAKPLPEMKTAVPTLTLVPPTAPPSPVPTLTSTPTTAPTSTPTPVPTATNLPVTPFAPVAVEAEPEGPVDDVALTLQAAGNLRIGPGRSYAIRTVIPEGTPVLAKWRSDDYWFLVYLEDGSEGWLALSVVADSLSAELRDLPIFPGY